VVVVPATTVVEETEVIVVVTVVVGVDVVKPAASTVDLTVLVTVAVFVAVTVGVGSDRQLQALLSSAPTSWVHTAGRPTEGSGTVIWARRTRRWAGAGVVWQSGLELDGVRAGQNARSITYLTVCVTVVDRVATVAEVLSGLSLVCFSGYGGLTWWS
jgi:hypothetical protein